MAEFNYALGGPGISVLWSITPAAGETPAAANAVVKKFRLTNQTEIRPDGNRLWTVTIANEEDGAEFQAFLDAALPASAATGTEAERTRESGTVIGGGTSGGTQYILAVAGPVDKAGGANRKIGLFPVTVDPTSGGWIQQANNPTAPTLIFKGYKNEGKITVGYALINAITDVDGTTALYEASGTPATYDIAANSGGLVSWLIPKYTP